MQQQMLNLCDEQSTLLCDVIIIVCDKEQINHSQGITAHSLEISSLSLRNLRIVNILKRFGGISI